jgi:hypothetical protein
MRSSRRRRMGRSRSCFSRSMRGAD